VNANKAERWKEIRPFLFAPALLISAYLLVYPGFAFLFVGFKSLRDLAFGVFAIAVFLVIFAIWWSLGPTLLLVVGTVFFFYVSMHGVGITYGDLRGNGLNPGLLISVNALMLIIVIGDVLTSQGKLRWRFPRKNNPVDRYQ
jgi:hypothetical protein